MQQEILASHPAARVQIYTVWFSMLPGDSRAGWDSSLLPDRRVTHLWDAERLVGRWFAAHAGDAQGIDWDGYWLYGPQARWADTPGPLVGSGGTVIGARAQLQQQILPFLSP